MITHLEPDSLECEVKWALGSIAMNKARGGDGIPAELLQILKDDAVKCWIQYASKFGKLSSCHRTGKDQLSFQSQRRAVPKNVQTTAQLCSFHLVERQCSKSFKPGFNSTWMQNFQMFKLVLEKAEEPEIKFPTPTGSQKKKQGNSRKTSASLTTWNPLCGSQQTVQYS